MELLLFSNGRKSEGASPLGYGLKEIEEQLKRTGAKKYLFIPYAIVSDQYAKKILREINEVMQKFGATVQDINSFDDPINAINNTDGFLITGGNTWLLTKMMHDKNLIGSLAYEVKHHNKPYIGWSAGSNLTCPTIRTTNDMPIVSAVTTAGLNFLTFQINPHYIDQNIAQYMGETRDERINEFIELNQHEIVVGLRENCLLVLSDNVLSFHSPFKNKLKVFRYNKPSLEFEDMADVSFLLDRTKWSKL